MTSPQAGLFDDLPYSLEEIICGVDEAGRGPLAGPVYAAAVILHRERPIPGLRDSNRLNILQASMLAMKRAVYALSTVPTLALIDGNKCPVMKIQTIAIIDGDDKIESISAASILAKTARDEALLKLHKKYPQYGFDQHKGYGTALHLERLREHGPSPVHRRSFAPVRELIERDAFL